MKDLHVISYSRLNHLCCPRKFYLAYIKGFEPIDDSPAVLFGKAGHKLLAGTSKEDMQEYSEYDIAVLDKLISTMREIYPEYGGCKVSEQELIVNIDYGIYLKGVIDSIHKDCIVEYKFSGSLYPELPRIIGQVAAYFLMLKKVNQAHIVNIRRPMLMQKTIETDDEFLARTLDGIEEHRYKYVSKTVISREEINLEHWKNTYISASKLIQEMVRLGEFPKVPASCPYCAYTPICTLEEELNEIKDSYDGFTIREGG